MRMGLGALVALVSGLVVGIQGVAVDSASAQTPIKVITSLPTFTVAAHFTILAKELDKKNGLAIETLQAGGSSSLQIDAVLSGNAMFGTPGTATALQAIREGADLKVIASIANNQLAAVINNDTLKKLGLSPTAPIADRIKAFKGLTIGTNPVGSTYYQVLRAYLKQYGLDPDKDVRLVAIADSNALIAGIQQGRYDAIVSASGVVEQAIGLNAATMWFSASRGDIPGSESAIVCVVVVRSDTLEKNKAEVAAYLAALQESMTAIRGDHKATGTILKAKFFPKMDQTIWDLAWDQANEGYPKTLAFPKAAFDYWVQNDPKGPDSFKNVDYAKIVYGPAQAN